MKDVYVGVDKDLEKIYLGLLRKELQNPTTWAKRSDYYCNEYRSKCLNDSRLNFLTENNHSDVYYDKVFIELDHSDFYTMEIGMFDFKTRKLLKRLFHFMEKRDKWEKSQIINNVLRDSLGESFDRLQKLLKIKKKMEG